MTVQLSLRYELNDWRKASATFLPEATDRGLIASNLLTPSLRGNPQQPSHGKAFKGGDCCWLRPFTPTPMELTPWSGQLPSALSWLLKQKNGLPGVFAPDRLK